MHALEERDTRTYSRLVLGATVIVFSALLSIASSPTVAQTTPIEDLPAAPAAGQMAQFPEVDTYRLQVYGDDFAEGLQEALLETVRDQRIQVPKQLKRIGALIRPDWRTTSKARRPRATPSTSPC